MEEIHLNSPSGKIINSESQQSLDYKYKVISSSRFSTPVKKNGLLEPSIVSLLTLESIKHIQHIAINVSLLWEEGRTVFEGSGSFI